MATPEEEAAAKAAEPKFASQVKKEVREQYADVLKSYAGKDVNELFLEHASLAQKVKERGIIIPTKDSPPEEVAEFHARMGLPTKAEEYDLKYDEKFVPKEVVDDAKAFVHANGYTRKQAQAYMTKIESIAKAAAGRTEARKAQGEANKMQALTAAMGGDSKAADAAYNLAVKKLAGYSEKTRTALINSGVAYDPDFLKDIAAEQAKLEPKGLVLGEGGAAAGGDKKPAGQRPSGQLLPRVAGAVRSEGGRSVVDGKAGRGHPQEYRGFQGPGGPRCRERPALRVQAGCTSATAGGAEGRVRGDTQDRQRGQRHRLAGRGEALGVPLQRGVPAPSRRPQDPAEADPRSHLRSGR